MKKLKLGMGKRCRCWSLAFSLLLLLEGCGSMPEGKTYISQRPALNLTDFFQGRVHAWGLVQNRSGKVVQRFRVEILGQFTDGQLILNEQFVYDLGEGPEQRVWTLTQTADNQWQGTASDILGVAEGELFGNALNWRYQMDLPIGSRTVKVSFDDWMWAMDEKTLFNRTQIKKLGFVVAEVTLFMQKKP